MYVCDKYCMHMHNNVLQVLSCCSTTLAGRNLYVCASSQSLSGWWWLDPWQRVLLILRVQQRSAYEVRQWEWKHVYTNMHLSTPRLKPRTGL